MAVKLYSQHHRDPLDSGKHCSCWDPDNPQLHSLSCVPHMRLNVRWWSIEVRDSLAWTIDIIDHFRIKKGHTLRSHGRYVFKLFWYYCEVRNLDGMSNSVIMPEITVHFKLCAVLHKCLHQTAVIIRKSSIRHLNALLLAQFSNPTCLMPKACNMLRNGMKEAVASSKTFLQLILMCFSRSGR